VPTHRERIPKLTDAFSMYTLTTRTFDSVLGEKERRCPTHPSGITSMTLKLRLYPGI
jgi:hypothetical protein